MRPVHIAIARAAGIPDEFRGDDDLVASLLRQLGAQVDLSAWSAEDVDWDKFDLVAIRSTWDYSQDQPRFVKWCAEIGDRLENDAGLVVWNSDKHYMMDLAIARIPTVPTRYVGPSDPYPEFVGEFVVKPTVSAGGKSTGRFGPSSHSSAIELIDEITASGGVAMIQPYQAAVATSGETAVVVIDGSVSHVLRKGEILQPDEVAPVSDDWLGVAKAMYEPDLVQRSEARPEELELTEGIMGWIETRFGTVPVACRVDMVRGADGRSIILELEAVEPYLYLALAPEAAVRLARVIFERAQARRARS